MELQDKGCLATNVTDEDFPIRMNTFNSTCHILLAAAGIPLNLIIAFAIVAYRRLHNKPRNILWLGVTLANLLTLFTILVELFAYHLRSLATCKVFISVTGLAYTWLLFNMLLALVDRYIAIVYPLWHRKNVSVGRVIAGQGIGAFLITLLIKLPFAIGTIPLECGIIPGHSKIIAVSNFVFLTLCILAQIVVYVKTRRCLGSDNGCDPIVAFVNQTSRQRRENNPDRPSDNAGNSISDRRQHETSSTGSSSKGERTNLETNTPTCGFGSSLLIRHHGGTRQMELEATWSLLIGVLSLLVFTCPTLILGFVEWGCRKIYGDFQCSSAGVATFYAREILLGHLVYNPVMYIIRSREFSAALSERCGMRRAGNPRSRPANDAVAQSRPVRRVDQLAEASHHL